MKFTILGLLSNAHMVVELKNKQLTKMVNLMKVLVYNSMKDKGLKYLTRFVKSG